MLLAEQQFHGRVQNQKLQISYDNNQLPLHCSMAKSHLNNCNKHNNISYAIFFIIREIVPLNVICDFERPWINSLVALLVIMLFFSVDFVEL